MAQMKYLHEYIVVRVSDVLNDVSAFKGLDGKRILIHTLYNPEKYVRCYGEVVGVPDTLPDSPLYSKPLGVPGYSNSPPFRYTKASDIAMDIRVGDKAYFHYGALLPDLQIGMYNHNYLGQEKIDGKMWHYFRVKYEMVFAVVRYEKINQPTRDFSWKIEGDLKERQIGNEVFYFYTDPEPAPFAEHIYRKRVIMIGSYVFIKADKETWEEISIPIPVMVGGKPLLDPHTGRPQMKPKDQWLVTKSVPGNRYLSGWIAHIDAPLKSEMRHRLLKKGMYVYFRRYTDTLVTFEGEEFWRLRQNYISMINPAKHNGEGQVSDPNGTTSESTVGLHQVHQEE